MPGSRSECATFLSRLREAVRADRVLVSSYAADLAAEDLGWDRADILLQLEELEDDDFERTEVSTVPGREADLVWVFCPLVDHWDIGITTLWIRLVERNGIVVVSFHRA